jgi:hypothetical protein
LRRPLGWPWRRRRVETLAATDRLAAAEREVEVSRQLLAETHETVIKPLQRYAEHNNFAELVAASLTQGRRKGSG